MERAAAKESNRAAVVLLSICGDCTVECEAPEACQVVDAADGCRATVECGIASEVESEIVTITINASSKAGATTCERQAGVEHKLVVVGLVTSSGDVGACNS